MIFQLKKAIKTNETCRDMNGELLPARVCARCRKPGRGWMLRNVPDVLPGSSTWTLMLKSSLVRSYFTEYSAQQRAPRYVPKYYIQLAQLCAPAKLQCIHTFGTVHQSARPTYYSYIWDSAAERTAHRQCIGGALVSLDECTAAGLGKS